ncbi:uncharacterized protein EDB93DRAFT_415613 [Suillus bovinus]|uniref:uncharacterized protein n=1 Tax=Suillus bovinus TaxID=48563 RepID=UPI001B8788A1|nr:uncharacterized protein EDB93DRAFT_415613 [Suillus bovinus]KAG2147451.1 hypothetical protein EDB93DRAFT_415613 [Suillus bovinus]
MRPQPCQTTDNFVHSLTSSVSRESLPTRFYSKHIYNMNTRVRENPFSETNLGITKCFCGNLTVENHDFCFCSPECARADALAALGGEDSHYRKVVRKAYVRCGARPPAIYKPKTEEKTPAAKHIPVIPVPPSQLANATYQHNNQNIGDLNDRSAKKEKVFPTLAQVTTAVLARKAKQGGAAAIETSVNIPQAAVQISFDALPVAPPPRIQRTMPGLDRGAHKLPFTQLRSAPRQIIPLKGDDKTSALRSQPSILHPVAEDRGRRNGDRVPLPRKPDLRAQERPMLPRLQRPVLQNATATIQPPGSLRRSASFAGWHSPAEHHNRVPEEGESLEELFDQLKDIRTWIEGWDGTPDYNKKPHRVRLE